MPNPATKVSSNPLERVFDRINYERQPGLGSKSIRLETITHVLDQLGNPHANLNIVHVGGTKGKGTTVQFVAAMGKQLGLRTASYSSPHLSSICERYHIDNTQIDEETLTETFAEVLAVVEAIDREIEQGLEIPPATFFDISTAAAFHLFRKMKAELVALEVGLGGRLDSTNVCDPLASVITTISKDHTKQLGDTLKQIAYEKAEIIKPDRVAISGASQPEIQKQIEEKAESVNAEFFQLGSDFAVEQLSVTPHGISFDYVDDKRDIKLEQIQLNLLAPHMANNAALAIKAITEVHSQIDSSSIGDSNVDDEEFAGSIRSGLQLAKIRGRFELLCDEPIIIGDMAHNEASIQALANALQQRFDDTPRQAVFSCAKDKDFPAMVPWLLKAFDRIIFTEFQSNPRAQKAATLKSLVNGGNQAESNSETEIVVAESPDSAFQLAAQETARFPITVLCGSAFLLGELLSNVHSEFGRLGET